MSILIRALLNLVIVYGVFSAVTLAAFTVLKVILGDASDPGPVASTIFIVGPFILLAPVLGVGLCLLDWVLKGVHHPRRGAAIVFLVPAAASLVLALQFPQALAYTLLLGLIGLAVAGLIRLPPRPARPDADSPSAA